MYFTCLSEPVLFSSQPGENCPEPLSNLQLEFLTSILHSNNCNWVRKRLFMAPGPPPPPQNAVMWMNTSIKSFLKQVLFSNGRWWQIFWTWSICSLWACPGNRKINKTKKVRFTLGCTNHRCFLKMFVFQAHSEFTRRFCSSFCNPSFAESHKDGV